MPLILSTLQGPLLQLFTKGTDVSAESAEIMSSAYVSYASTAIFPPDVPVFTGLEKALMKATLIAAMNPFLPNPAGLGAAWAAGIQAFWTSPPIACLGGAPGAVTAVPGAASLPATMLAITSVPFQPASVAATGIAAAIDAATRTTIATLTIAGVPTPVPIA